MPATVEPPAALPATPAPAFQTPLEAGFSNPDGPGVAAPAAPSAPADFHTAMEAAKAAPGRTVAPAKPSATPPPAPPADAKQDAKPATVRSRLDPTKRTSDDWKTLRGVVGEKETKIAALEAQLQALQNGTVKPAATAAAPAPPAQDPFAHPDVAKLKSEHAQYADIVRGLAVEHDPEFKARFDTKRDAALKAVKFAAAGAADKVALILQQPPSEYRDAQVLEAVKDFSDTGRVRLLAALTTYNSAEVERSVEIETRKATWEGKQAELASLTATQQRQRQATLDAALESRIKAWQSSMPFYQQRENDHAWNQQVQEGIDLARNMYNGNLSPEELADAAMWVPVGPRALDQLQQAMGQIEAWRAAYARLSGVQPDSLGSATPDGRTAVPAPTDPEAYREFFVQQLEAARNAPGR